VKTIRISIDIEHLHEDIVTDDDSAAICEDASLAIHKTVDDGVPAVEVVAELMKEISRRYITLNARKTN
jgi:hypothetical protein